MLNVHLATESEQQFSLSDCLSTWSRNSLELQSWNNLLFFMKTLHWSWCYKTFFGGNLDFPKIKKLNKVCCDDWPGTKMLTQCYFKINYVSTLWICSKMASTILAVSAKGKSRFPPKKFYNIILCQVLVLGNWLFIFANQSAMKPIKNFLAKITESWPGRHTFMLEIFFTGLRR